MSDENTDLRSGFQNFLVFECPRRNLPTFLDWPLSTFPEDRASLGKTCACSPALSGRQQSSRAAEQQSRVAVVPTTQGTWAMAMPAPAYYAIAQPEPPQSFADSVSFGVIIPFVNVKKFSSSALRPHWSRI